MQKAVEQLLFVYNEFLGIFSFVVVLDIESNSALFYFQVSTLLISYIKVPNIPKNGGKEDTVENSNPWPVSSVPLPIKTSNRNVIKVAKRFSNSGFKFILTIIFGVAIANKEIRMKNVLVLRNSQTIAKY